MEARTYLVVVGRAVLHPRQAEEVEVMRVVVREHPPARALAALELLEPVHVRVPETEEGIQVQLCAGSGGDGRQSEHFSSGRDPGFDVLLRPDFPISAIAAGQKRRLPDCPDVDPVQLGHAGPDPATDVPVAHIRRDQRCGLEKLLHAPISKGAIHTRPDTVSRREDMRGVQLLRAGYKRTSRRPVNSEEKRRQVGYGWAGNEEDRIRERPRDLEELYQAWFYLCVLPRRYAYSM